MVIPPGESCVVIRSKPFQHTTVFKTRGILGGSGHSDLPRCSINWQKFIHHVIQPSLCEKVSKWDNNLFMLIGGEDMNGGFQPVGTFRSRKT